VSKNRVACGLLKILNPKAKDIRLAQTITGHGSNMNARDTLWPEPEPIDRISDHQVRDHRHVTHPTDATQYIVVLG
jgi:hypothetical protein